MQFASSLNQVAIYDCYSDLLPVSRSGTDLLLEHAGVKDSDGIVTVNAASAFDAGINSSEG